MGYNKDTGEIVALENQRYGRNKDTLVNKTYIESGEYRRKFDSLTDNADVNKTLYECAKKALKHRSGTELEDMYRIDEKSGRIIYAVTNSTERRGIPHTKDIDRKTKGKDNILTLHTHPGSMPPSAEDFNACFEYGYNAGYVVCHDGKVFKATPHKDRLTALHAIYLWIFRHSTQSLLAIREYACVNFMHSAEKSDCVSDAQSLCGIALSILQLSR